MRDSCQTINSATPTATQGWNSAPMYSSGEERCADAGNPRFRKKSPNGLEKTTIAVKIQVLSRRRAVSDVMRRALVPGIGRNGRGLGSPLLRHELLPLAAQRHVFAGFLGEPPPFVGVEDRLPHDAPDHPRPEEVQIGRASCRERVEISVGAV